MDRFRRNIKRKLSAIICTTCGLAGHSNRDERCPQWDARELQTYPPLSPQCYVELTSLLCGYRDQVSLTDDDLQYRERICEMIENAIRPLHPNVQLVLFGSSANGFGTIHSDLDISMILKGACGHKKQSSLVRSLMKQLRKQSSRDKWNQEDVKCIPWAKVPIVKMTLSHKWKSLECDISVGNYLALHNTEMLSAYARIDERVQILGVALKQFVKSNGVCDASTGSLSSYAYIILLLHYLQQVTPPVIPVLQQVGASGTTIVDGCNCWFYQFHSLHQLSSVWPHVKNNQSSVGELWVCFFKYYTEEFDWNRGVVTVRRLQPLSKLEKCWTHKRACIEDPFNLDRNLAGHLSDAKWACIQEVLDNGRNRFSDPVFYRTPMTCERLFDGCEGIADIPLKPIKRVPHNASSARELSTISGKRQRHISNPRDNTIIYIDDDDDDEDDVIEFIPKKQRMVSDKNKDTQRNVQHIQFSSSLLKHHPVSSDSVPINVTSHFKSTTGPAPKYHELFPHKQTSASQSVHTKPIAAPDTHYPLMRTSEDLLSRSSMPGPHFSHTNPPVSYNQPPSTYHFPYTEVSTKNPDTSRTPMAGNFHFKAAPMYDHDSITSEHSYRQVPWLNRTPEHHHATPEHHRVTPERHHVTPEHHHVTPECHRVTPEMLSRRQDDDYRRYPITYPLPHVSNSQAEDYRSRDHGRSIGTTSNGSSSSSSSWQTPPGSSSATGHWQQSGGNRASNNAFGLFPLLYANSVLSSYSSYHDNSRGDHYHDTGAYRKS